MFFDYGSCGVNVIVGRSVLDKPNRTWTIEGNCWRFCSGDIIKLKSGYNSLLLSSYGYFDAGNGCVLNVTLRTNTSNPDYNVYTSWKICVSGRCIP